jgi:hypothetical protein
MATHGAGGCSGDAQILRPRILRLLGLGASATDSAVAEAIAEERRVWSCRTNSPMADRRDEAEQMLRWLDLAENVLSSRLQSTPPCSAPRASEPQTVCSHGMGVVANGRNHVLIPRNTPIPCEAKHVVSTDTDNQTELTIQVTEGECEELEYVTVLDAHLRIPPYPKGAPIELAFQYAVNGVIRITALDVTAKRSLGELELARKGELTDGQVRAKQVELGENAVI